MLLNFTRRCIHRHVWWEWRQKLESALSLLAHVDASSLRGEKSPFGNIKYTKLYSALNQNMHQQTTSTRGVGLDN